jgi:hypothetical protein
MSAPQKHAWFNLVVIAATLAIVLLLYPVLGKGALGGLGFLGLLGLGGFFYRKKRGQVLTDERDNLIHQRSTIAAYSVFWLAFVAAGVLTPLYYGYDGAVPAILVANAVWAGVMLLIVTQSVATLVQYSRGSDGTSE